MRTRSFSTQVVTAEVNMRVALLITELMRFQTRAILKDEVKGRMRKRVVFGFREVRVHECPQPLPVPASSSPRVRALTP